MVFSRLYYLMKLQEAAIVWNLNLSCRICIWCPRHVSKFVLRTCQSPFMLDWAVPQRREGHRPPQGCLKPGSMDLTQSTVPSQEQAARDLPGAHSCRTQGTSRKLNLDLVERPWSRFCCDRPEPECDPVRIWAPQPVSSLSEGAPL